MLDAVYSIIAKKLLARKIINEDDEDVIIYGLDMIVYTIVSLVGIILLGAFIGLAYPTFLLLLFQIPIQSCGGGFHAKTHLRCFALMIVSWGLVMLLYSFLSTYLLVLLCIPSILITWLIAPIEHINAPMSSRKRKKMRKITQVYACVISVSSISFIGILPHIASIASLALFSCSISMLCALGAKTTIRKHNLNRLEKTR